MDDDIPTYSIGLVLGLLKLSPMFMPMVRENGGHYDPDTIIVSSSYSSLVAGLYFNIVI